MIPIALNLRGGSWSFYLLARCTGLPCLSCYDKQPPPCLFLYLLNNLRSHLVHICYRLLCWKIRSGVLQIGDLRYEIEPVENSSTFQHLVYRRALEGGSRQLCQVPEEHKDHLPEFGELANRSHKILVIEVRTPHPLVSMLHVRVCTYRLC